MANGANVSSVAGKRPVHDVRIDRPREETHRIRPVLRQKRLVDGSQSHAVRRLRQQRLSGVDLWKIAGYEFPITRKTRGRTYMRDRVDEKEGMRILTDNNSSGRHVVPTVMHDWYGIVTDVEGVEGVVDQAEVVPVGSHRVRVCQDQVVDQYVALSVIFASDVSFPKFLGVESHLERMKSDGISTRSDNENTVT